jgi:hypothetical protein
LRRLIGSVATAQGETAVALSLAVVLAPAAGQIFLFMRDVDWDLLLYIYRMRHWDRLRDVNWVWFGNLDVMGHRVRYLDRDLNLVRHLLLYSVWDFSLHHYGIRLGDFHRVGFRDCHMDRDFDFVGNFLLHGDCVGFGDRVRHFLGDYYGPHVLLLVFLHFTAIYIFSAVTILLETPLLQLSRTQSEDYRQQRECLDNKCSNLVIAVYDGFRRGLIREILRWETDGSFLLLRRKAGILLIILLIMLKKYEYSEIT